MTGTYTIPPMNTKAEQSPENRLEYPSAHMISSFKAITVLTKLVAPPQIEKKYCTDYIVLKWFSKTAELRKDPSIMFWKNLSRSIKTKFDRIIILSYLHILANNWLEGIENPFTNEQSEN